MKYSSLSPEIQDQIYEVFRTSYLNRTGQAWDRQTFESRAQSWELFGSFTDPVGFITVRVGRQSGLAKITGAAGSNKGILQGLKQAVATYPAMWLAADPQLTKVATRYGFVQPPVEVMKELYPYISFLLPGAEGTYGDNGVQVSLAGGLGQAVKTFAATPEFFKTAVLLAKSLGKMPEVSPDTSRFFNSVGVRTSRRQRLVFRYLE